MGVAHGNPLWKKVLECQILIWDEFSFTPKYASRTAKSKAREDNLSMWKLTPNLTAIFPREDPIVVCYGILNRTISGLTYLTP